MRPVVCKFCGSINKHYSTWCIMKPKSKNAVKMSQTRIKKAGKEFDRWKTFREDVAIPYLDSNFGHNCRCCGVTGNLDIDHIHSKGSHPGLKYQLSNLQYLDRVCHYWKTNYPNKKCPHKL